jgi:putative ABC transport system ATP-binding protein
VTTQGPGAAKAASTSGGSADDGLEPGFLRFVWRHSAREQLFILAVTAATFPLVYLSLEVPKMIVNDAIQGSGFPRAAFGFAFSQTEWLLLLCGLFLALVVAINGLKWVLNVSVGMTGERMLRRLRLLLFQRVMRFRLSRFRAMKPGEILQSILGEIEPLGGFIGEVIATPVFQGGLLVVYLTFIFVQDVWLGLAAISLYPVQALIVPRLQREVVRLNRARAANTRLLADELSETFGQIEDVHASGAARWRIAQISGRLHRNTEIRKRLFERKFTIKFVSNLLNQLTPFFFYAIGGALVIAGRMDFGSLVAVLAAYKDLAGPWRELMSFGQRWTDFNGRYAYVLENFVGEDVLGPARLAPDSAALAGPLTLEGVEGGPGAGGLSAPSVAFAPGGVTAVIGGEGGARDALLRIAVGLADPARGVVAVGGRALVDAPIGALGATFGFVGAEPGLMDRSVGENLVYGLLRAEPDLAARADAEGAFMLREARRAGGVTADPDADWVDPKLAGAEDRAALDARLVALAESFGLAPDLLQWAMAARLGPEAGARWAEPCRSAREALARALDPETLADLVRPLDRDALNPDACLLENLLFAAGPVGLPDPGDAAASPAVARILARVGGDALLAEIGWDIARELAAVVEAVGREARVLDGVGGFTRGQVLAAADLVARHARPGRAGGVPPKARGAVVAMAARFIPERDRLEVLGAERVARLLGARRAAEPWVVQEPSLEPLDRAGFASALSLTENVLRGKRRHDRRSAWGRIDSHLAAAFESAGLRPALVALGMNAPAGSGGLGLSLGARRRVALIRAVVKRPSYLVLNGMAGGADAADAELRDRARRDSGGAALIYAASGMDAARGADHVLLIGSDGVARMEPAPPAEGGRGVGRDGGDGRA